MKRGPISTIERAEAVVADDEQTINDVRWRQTLREFYGPLMVQLGLTHRSLSLQNVSSVSSVAIRIASFQ
jgi:hypothetical protein